MEASLSEVCYEHIKDQYWYGLFGDFKLIIDRNTGYFNATKLCHQGGKLFGNWFQNKQSKELIEYYGNKIHGPNSNLPHFIVKKGGNQNDVRNTIISGTYIPKELILSLSLWISKDFYDKACAVVKSFYVREFNERYANNMDQLQQRLHRVETEMAQVRMQNARYQHFEEDIAFKTVNVQKRHAFAVIQKNCSTEYPLHVIRTQQVNFQTQVKQMSEKYPHSRILLQLEYNPNAINLFNRVKERIGNIQVRYNDVKLLNGYTDEEFIREIQKIANTTVNTYE